MKKRTIGLGLLMTAVCLLLVGCTTTDPAVKHAEDALIEKLQGQLADGAGTYKAKDIGDSRAIILYPTKDSEFGTYIVLLEEKINESAEKDKDTKTFEELGGDLGMWAMWGTIQEAVKSLEKEMTSDYLEDHSIGLAHPVDKNKIILLVKDGAIVEDGLTPHKDKEVLPEYEDDNK